MSDERQPRDPWAEAQADTTDNNALAQQQRARDYERMSMRLNCLSMALVVPDGAQPPPLAEVIERARTYWRFVETGE